MASASSPLPGPPSQAHPPFGEAFRFWVRLGFINFGGPSGQIALMHQELVDRRRWISNSRFLHALNYCMLLPGPEAQQLATYVGWLLHGAAGGLAAGILFIVPSFFLMLALSWLAAAHAEVAWVSAVFFGLGSAVVGLVVTALLRIGARALKNPAMTGVAAASFMAIYAVGVPFPFVVVAAGLTGLAAGVRWPDTFAVIKEDVGNDQAVLHDTAATPAHAHASAVRALRVLVVGLGLWIIPLAIVAALDLGTNVFADQAWFFSKSALVTFGGAYAVLAYINRAAVATYGWVTSQQMVTGLGLAESTPGPLIMVTQFVGFLGAYRFHGDLPPVAAGVLGSVVVVWATFAPSFLWIFLGAPYIESLRDNVRLTAALSTITAAVVGVIAGLAVTFGITALFESVAKLSFLDMTITVPVPRSLDPLAAAIALVAFLGTWKFKWNVSWVVLGAAVAGLLRLPFG